MTGGNGNGCHSYWPLSHLLCNAAQAIDRARRILYVQHVKFVPFFFNTTDFNQFPQTLAQVGCVTV